jgi:AraC-like DNA-binding protein
MSARLKEAGRGQLEPLCKRARIRIGAGAEGIERIEASFFGQAFSPHRHDTYALGLTLAGVQTFRYRGEQRFSLPGECHILYPDEMHDGASATDEAFRYRIVYLDPRLIQDALGGAPLPFVHTPVIAAARIPAELRSAAWDIGAEIDEIARNDLVVAVADFLLQAAQDKVPRTSARAYAETMRIRELIAARPEQRCSMAALERFSGIDRWTIARQFRLCFGTSPSRFRTLRQLDRVRRLLVAGTPLAEAALEAGFADQSHMSRRFKSAYGLTPAAWLAAQARF